MSPPTSESSPSSRSMPLSEPRALPGRFISLGAKLALAVVLVLTLASTLIALELTNQARTSLVEQKRLGAAMVADLFAVNAAPALDFGDREELDAELKTLESNKDIVFAAVYAKGQQEPKATLGEKQEPRALTFSGLGREDIHDDLIELERPLLGPGGNQLGAVVVQFTLKPEVQAFEAQRSSILIFSGGAAALIAALVLGFARFQVVRPLERLVDATKRIQRGEHVQVKASANDEIGRLAESFSVMAEAVVDREARLADVNRRLQQLLDHMRQAILVFGTGGTVESIQSRQASIMFSGEAVGGAKIQDLLYPTGVGVEAQAFQEWLEVAFGQDEETWKELVELAPAEVTLPAVDGDESRDSARVLSLVFRPIFEDGQQLQRVMLLATDETDKRRLQRAVKESEEEHARQMSAMRRLVAGGGQLLVDVLDQARQRLEICQELLDAEPSGDAPIRPETVESIFQHAHTIKGEARAFDLSALESAAVKLEDELMKLRGRLRDGGQPKVEQARGMLEPEFAGTRSAVDHAAEMLVEASPIGPAILEQVTVRRADLARLAELVAGKQGELAEVSSRLSSRPFGESALILLDAIPRWAERLGKRARLHIEGRDAPVPAELGRSLSGVLTHLARNAVAHGIEQPEEREARGKPAIGTITARCINIEKRSGLPRVRIEVEDDGRGIDVEVISDRARDHGLSSRADAEELVFEPGLTSLDPDATDELAGLGTGLGAVREELRKVGYKVTLHSVGGRGVKVVIA